MNSHDGKSDFFTELPSDIFQLIFSLIPELEVHLAFILTCKKNYDKWKENVRKNVEFRESCLSEGLKLSRWNNFDYKDLYNHKDTRVFCLVPVFQGGIDWETDHKEGFSWQYINTERERSLFPFAEKLPPISEKRILGFYKVTFSVKELHQKAIRKKHCYLMSFFRDAKQIESYFRIDNAKEYKNPSFTKSL